jgi:hypothetical protein
MEGCISLHFYFIQHYEKWLFCSAGSLFCYLSCQLLVTFCQFVWGRTFWFFVRMVDIFHSITNEWAKFDTKDMFFFYLFSHTSPTSTT